MRTYTYQTHPYLSLKLLLFLAVSTSVNSLHSDPFPGRTANQHDERNLQDNIFVRQKDGIPASDPEKAFIERCSSDLLSESVMQDQKISNFEFAAFLENVCAEKGTCQPDTFLSLDSVNSKLRSAFVSTACPVGKVEVAACYYDFKSTGAEYGLVATPDILTTVDQRVASLCTSTYTIIETEGIFGEKLQDPHGDEKIIPPRPTEEPQPSSTSAPLLVPPSPTTATPGPVVEQEVGTISSSTLNSTETEVDDREKLVTDLTDFEETEDGGLSTAGIFGIISAAASIAFCVAVMYSGGFKEPDYDVNTKRGV
jgi:hypothetical protein